MPFPQPHWTRNEKRVLMRYIKEIELYGDAIINFDHIAYSTWEQIMIDTPIRNALDYMLPISLSHEKMQYYIKSMRQFKNLYDNVFAQLSI